MATTPKKNRAVTAPKKDAGTQRYDLFQQADERIAAAMERKYFLEAITIIESLIAERLESRLAKILGADFSCKPLEALIDQANQSETDEILKKLVTLDLPQWREQRTQILYEIVKIKPGDLSTWDERNRKLKPVAAKGFALLKEIANRAKILRRMEQKGEIPAAE